MSPKLGTYINTLGKFIYAWSHRTNKVALVFYFQMSICVPKITMPH